MMFEPRRTHRPLCAGWRARRLACRATQAAAQSRREAVGGLRRGGVRRCRDRTADGVPGRVGREADELPGGFELLVLRAQTFEFQPEVSGGRLDDP